MKLVRPDVSDSGDELTVVFISDLHLLSSRHDYGRHEASVRTAVQKCDVCIWGGDLFDFHWSCEGDGPRSRGIAIDWLQAWRDEFPDKCFVYLNGNHDAQAEFQKSLAAWADPVVVGDQAILQPGRVLAGIDAVRIDDCLLVHGDVIESIPRLIRPSIAKSMLRSIPQSIRRDAGLAQYRKRWDHERIGIAHPPVIGNRLYNAAVAGRLHLATAGIAHRHRSVCLRLLRWLDEQPSWVGDGVRRIVFGHTHRRLAGVSIHGVEFYNGGAAVRHVGFEPVIVRVG